MKDPGWATEQLKKYLDLFERVPLPEAEQTPRKRMRIKGTEDERYEQGLVVRHIWEAMWGEWPERATPQMAKRCLFEIARGEEIRQYLAFDEGPSLIADDLHPWVWQAAASHWASDAHRAAVWAAGINVNSRIQKKVGRYDLSESKLIQEVFSTKQPEPGKPRLRLCDDTNADLFKDMHVGAINFGNGLYMAVSNVVNHIDPERHDMTPQEALEALAAFSLLARWVDGADVQRHAEDL